MDPFASPSKFDHELLSFLQEACNELCEWFKNSKTNGPLPTFAEFPKVEPSIKGLSSKELLFDLQKIMNGAYRPSHPGALAHLDPPPLTASIVGDLICAGLNNNLLAEELSPSLSRLEKELCYWFANQIGMETLAGGVAASGGTLSNLMALVVARRHAGLQLDPSAVILASSDAHVSLVKLMTVMGLNSDSLRLVNVDIEGSMSIPDLKKQLKKLKAEGKKCFAIVATAGTTIRGAVDPICEISKLSTNERIWLHVDASIGGVFTLSSGTSRLVRGLNLANSVTLNPQKLLGVSKTSSILILADRTNLNATFSTGLPYFEPVKSNEYHFGEMGLQGTRSAEVLKLWLGLKQLGEKGIENILEQAISRKQYFLDKLDISKFQLCTGPLHLLAFTPKNLNLEKAKVWSINTRETLLRNNFMLSRPLYQGRFYLKAVFGNPHTDQKHLDSLAELVNESTAL